MIIPEDVRRYIKRRFAAADRAEAAALLERAVLHDGSTPGPRLLRCAAVASGGSMGRLRMEIDTLRTDYRDVIMDGEYVPRGMGAVRVRDFLLPIPDDA